MGNQTYRSFFFDHVQGNMPEHRKIVWCMTLPYSAFIFTGCFYCLFLSLFPNAVTLAPYPIFLFFFDRN
ncbi:MAG: hypothetical protein CSA23_07685 [Deltaproteobacteria bacterium]|nr:MAG: hypothetical protein CSA23_07685 [Deltaproteobacteria bacterium]